jgi:hypothetical protein
MEMEELDCLSAFRLWNANLISDSVFFEIMHKLKGTTTTTKTTTNPNAITDKQKNYIEKLMREGKIPKTQSLNISKADAQALIKSAIEHNPQLSNTPEGIVDTSKRNLTEAEGGIATNPPSDLYEDETEW